MLMIRCSHGPNTIKLEHTCTTDVPARLTYLHRLAMWCNMDPCGLVCAVITYSLILFAQFSVTSCVLGSWMGGSFFGVVNVVLFNLLACLAHTSHARAMLTDPGAVSSSALVSRGYRTHLNPHYRYPRNAVSCRRPRSMSAVSCLLYLVYCILSTVSCLLYLVYYILSTASCLLYLGYCILSTVSCLRYLVYCILSTVSCLLYLVYCILSTVSCPLYIVYCNLSVFLAFNGRHNWEYG